MRRRPSRADGAGNRETEGKAGALEPLGEVGDERMLAAPQMRAAADIEQQAVGRIDGHQRRIAQAPIGDGFEQGCVGLGVFGDGLESRMHGACLRQRQVRREAEPFRRRIDGDEQLGIAALAVDGKRRRDLRRLFARFGDAVGREPAQPQAEQARAGNAHRCHSIRESMSRAGRGGCG